MVSIICSTVICGDCHLFEGNFKTEFVLYEYSASHYINFHRIYWRCEILSPFQAPSQPLRSWNWSTILILEALNINSIRNKNIISQISQNRVLASSLKLVMIITYYCVWLANFSSDKQCFKINKWINNIS